MFIPKNTTEPHLGKKILYTGADPDAAKQAIILIHGRGGSAESMLNLVPLLEADTDTMLIIPQADSNTWYPYRFIEPRRINEPALSSALHLIHALVSAANQNGIANENIYLLGFSQGACLVADFVARNPARYGGVFVLSGGLIGDILNSEDYRGSLQNTPVFLGCSDTDFHIPEERVHQSADIFAGMNADVTKRIYPDMGHTINQDEIDHINRILSAVPYSTASRT